MIGSLRFSFLGFGNLEKGGGSPLISGMAGRRSTVRVLECEEVTGWIELIRYRLALAWLGDRGLNGMEVSWNCDNLTNWSKKKSMIGP